MHHIAFDRLKSHTPFPCPASQLIKYLSEVSVEHEVFFFILCVMFFSVNHPSCPEEDLIQSRYILVGLSAKIAAIDAHWGFQDNSENRITLAGKNKCTYMYLTNES